MITIDELKYKQFYRSIEFALRQISDELTHERYKLIALNKYKCESKEEIRVKKYTNAFIYILNNYNQIINSWLLNDIYYLLCGEILEDKVNKEIIKIIYTNFDENPYYIAAKIHIEALSFDIKEKEKYAILLTNLILLKKRKI